MQYSYQSRLGQFTLLREGCTWRVEFNTVPIGEGYASAEQALSCLVRGAGLTPAVAELVGVADLPTSLTAWQHLPPSPDGPWRRSART